VRTITGAEFDAYWESVSRKTDNDEVDKVVKEIIAAVREEGDGAVKRFAAKFDRSSPERLEVHFSAVKEAAEVLAAADPALYGALKFAASNIVRFARLQREQFKDFETEIAPGLFTGQKVIPVQRAGVYIPGGRFPLISTVLMTVIPAFAAGAEEVVFASPPESDGIPDRRTLAAVAVAAEACGIGADDGFGVRLRVFAMGGAQAIAALAYGTASVPACGMIAGPGNKYVAAAKRLVFGDVGIDFIAGPTDVLVITGGLDEKDADIAAADLLAQAEHDPDARARALVPDRESAEVLAASLEKRLASLPTAETARASLEAGGLIVIYDSPEEAARIANVIAPEHLELQTGNDAALAPLLKNYGSLFTGKNAAEVLGDYSAGVNHTLPTSGSARFTGGLSVRHFLKTVTTLRCEKGTGYDNALEAARQIAAAEGLAAHRASIARRVENRE